MLTDLRVEGGELRAVVRADSDGVACPARGTWSGRVHGSYTPSVCDLPVGGRSTAFVMRVRRFVCAAQECPRRTSCSRCQA
ncbi:transposase family protein [Kutzneria sp. CA-103260]|uniref:transposase family protein n=1 Tax=Kutzneria sp. CA-103260 TaxID=2802641 RepID=UPI003FA59D03